MAERVQCIVGTSGYSFADWVGTFYPPGTNSRDMFAHYVKTFPAVELNYTYYRMPAARTLESLAAKSPPEFLFWVKANQETTHKQNRQVAAPFVDALTPLRQAGKLAGVLLQFPQGFHRTMENRKYLAATLEDLAACPLAVEFRHRSWQEGSTIDGLRQRNVTLVVPDVPAGLTELFHSPPTATTETGYLRLHSRNAAKWYAGEAQRYDYSYSAEELAELVRGWVNPGPAEPQVKRLYAFFNNCHGGQAARDAQAFQNLLNELG